MSDLVKHHESGARDSLVSVAMPVYNAGNDLLLAVRSVVKQTYENWELLLIDDGSTDGAVERVRAEIIDPRICIISDGRNLGLTSRLNQAVDIAKGRFLARMDQDDICYPQRFEKQVCLLQQDQSLDVVAVKALTISPDNEPIGYFPFRLTHDEIVAKPWHGFYFPHPTWMGRTTWFRRHRYATYYCEDQELLLRSYSTSRFATVPEILFAYRLRKTFNWQKTIRIRRVFLGLQLKKFLVEKTFLWALLALLTFALKGARDKVVQVAFRQNPAAQRSARKIAQADLEKWSAVLFIVQN